LKPGVSATRQKNVRQKNKRCHFSVSHFFVWWVPEAATTVKTAMSNVNAPGCDLTSRLNYLPPSCYLIHLFDTRQIINKQIALITAGEKTQLG